MTSIDVYENNMQVVLKTRFFGLGIDVKSNNVYFHPGLFQDTLNKTTRSDVAFAHVDGYWYETDGGFFWVKGFWEKRF